MEATSAKLQLALQSHSRPECASEPARRVLKVPVATLNRQTQGGAVSARPTHLAQNAGYSTSALTAEALGITQFRDRLRVGVRGWGITPARRLRLASRLASSPEFAA